jgi:hypothetical protein
MNKMPAFKPIPTDLLPSFIEDSTLLLHIGHCANIFIVLKTNKRITEIAFFIILSIIWRN